MEMEGSVPCFLVVSLTWHELEPNDPFSSNSRPPSWLRTLSGGRGSGSSGPSAVEAQSNKEKGAGDLGGKGEGGPTQQVRVILHKCFPTHSFVQDHTCCS